MQTPWHRIARAWFLVFLQKARPLYREAITPALKHQLENMISSIFQEELTPHGIDWPKIRVVIDMQDITLRFEPEDLITKETMDLIQAGNFNHPNNRPDWLTSHKEAPCNT